MFVGYMYLIIFSLNLFSLISLCGVLIICSCCMLRFVMICVFRLSWCYWLCWVFLVLIVVGWFLRWVSSVLVVFLLDSISRML